MKYIHLCMLFVTGLSALNLVSTRFSILEKTGFSFVLGFGFITLMMFFYALLGIHISVVSLYGAQIILILASLATVFIKHGKRIPLDFPELKNLRGISLFSLNLTWVLVVSVLGYLVYVTLTKTMFWPTISYDSIAGYDFMGKVMAAEGVVKSSMFSSSDPFYSIRCGYPLFVPGSFGYAYMLGFETSKISTALMIVSMIIIFYALLLKYAGHTVAAIFTLLFISTPEYVAMGALSLSNVPHTLLVVGGVITLFIWMDRGEQRYLYLSLILLALNVWTRSDGVNFLAGCGVVMLLNGYKTRNWKPLVLMVVVTAIPFLMWQVYLVNVLSIENSSVFIKSLFWDGEKFSQLMTLIWAVMKSTQYYGVAPFLIPLGIFVNVTYLHKVNYQLLIMILVSLAVYIALYYQMDTGSAEFSYSLRGMITSSYKRGMFSIVGLLYFYVAISPMAKKLFRFALEKTSWKATGKNH